MRFKAFDQRGEAFSVGGLKAGYEFATESSISFYLWVDGSLGDSLGTGLGVLRSYPVRLNKGNMEVHYPCHEHVKLQIRIILPKSVIEGYDHKTRFNFFDTIVEVLDIPSDETYEMHFIEAESGIIYGNYTNRDGLTDRI
jgi:hypothetical protein